MDQEKVKFHAILEKEIVELGYGQINVNVILKDGIPVISTMNIIRQKRRKYKIGSQDKKK